MSCLVISTTGEKETQRGPDPLSRGERRLYFARIRLEVIYGARMIRFVSRVAGLCLDSDVFMDPARRCGYVLICLLYRFDENCRRVFRIGDFANDLNFKLCIDVHVWLPVYKGTLLDLYGPWMVNLRNSYSARY